MELGKPETEVLWRFSEKEPLCRLSSIYEACTLSASDPVSVPSDIDLAGRHTYSHMFYDCIDSGNRGIETMNQRIREAGDDIQTHLKIHDALLGNFYSVDEALRTSDRERIVEAGRFVFGNLEKYGRLVGEHSNRLGERAFLNYPTCLPGHFFAPRGTGVIMEKDFNPEQNEDGLRRDIESGLLVLENFPLKGNGFGETRMYSGYDSGKGVLSTSLRGRLELTRVLLERAGFFSSEIGTNPEGEIQINIQKGNF